MTFLIPRPCYVQAAKDAHKKACLNGMAAPGDENSEDSDGAPEYVHLSMNPHWAVSPIMLLCNGPRNPPALLGIPTLPFFFFRARIPPQTFSEHKKMKEYHFMEKKWHKSNM